MRRMGRTAEVSNSERRNERGGLRPPRSKPPLRQRCSLPSPSAPSLNSGFNLRDVQHWSISMERRTEAAVTLAWGSCELTLCYSPATGREKARNTSGLCWL
ncbi:hypothetical protein AV530_006106 [Patagioenas fasciata monilis]|uniref:Uncharacterized protein n=1 Tax=Patagioenas fasciata monilis TaxID=372326 RepID=A0A1V4J907_PATFA|nr:hypothetical protein AV530_006106 [Patagioenas fasciata monilis]